MTKGTTAESVCFCFVVGLHRDPGALTVENDTIEACDVLQAWGDWEKQEISSLKKKMAIVSMYLG
jgi:hypothetical protein